MARFLTNLLKSKSQRRRTNASLRPNFDRLEERQLLSATAVLYRPLPIGPGILRVTGSARNDTILVRQLNNRISVNGVAGSWRVSDVLAIEVRGLAGNDTILLNSEQSGGQALSVGCLVDGGAGNDFIMGSAKRDLLYGSGGDDLIHGRDGNDYLVGGNGRDSLFGDQGDDVIMADLVDQSRGGAGHDKVILAGLDPSQLPVPPVLAELGVDPAGMIKTAINTSSAFQSCSFEYHHDGDHVYVKNLHVTDVTMTNGVTRITFEADDRYQKTRGFPQGSVSGTVKFSFQAIMHITVGDTSGASKVENATLTMADTQMTKETLSSLPSWVPSWVTNHQWVRGLMNS